MGFNERIKELVSEKNITDLKRDCTDKLKAKDYVSKFNLPLINIPKVIKVIGKKIELYGSDWTKYKFPLYIKCNHGWRYQILCKNFLDLCNEHNISKMNNFIHCNFYKKHGEYQYSNIDKKIYLEEFIEIDTLMQFYCFHGEPTFLENIKKAKDHYTSICCNEYNIKYEEFKFTKCIKNYNLTPKPDFYDELVEDTKIISKDFDFVRVDYYVDVNGKVYFSELTFSPGAGGIQFKDDMNEYFGKLL